MQGNVVDGLSAKQLLKLAVTSTEIQLPKAEIDFRLHTKRELQSIGQAGRKVLPQQLKKRYIAMLSYLQKLLLYRPLIRDLTCLDLANKDKSWTANAFERLCIALPDMVSSSQVFML